jgi:uncharacterized protein (DUF362 family)
MGNIVSLVSVKNSTADIKRAILEALKLAEFKFPKAARSVAIKPNLAYYWDAATGYTTDPRVVAAIIDIIREKCGEDVDIKVVEADASAMRTKYAFKVLGYEKLAEEKKVELFNLSKGVLDEKTVQVGKREITFKVPQLLLDSDLFIDVPKLKLMRIVKITCAMKNIFGCIGKPRKIVYHPILNDVIVGINKVLKPHLTIVDGLVAAGRFPIKLNLIMAGVDPFSIDWVASQIMGFKPSSVKFLKIAIKEKVGDPEGVITRGENIDEFAKIFPKEGFISASSLWSIEFWLLKTYQKIVGDIIPPVFEE